MNGHGGETKRNECREDERPPCTVAVNTLTHRSPPDLQT
jgi:hypothetical protein